MPDAGPRRRVDPRRRLGVAGEDAVARWYEAAGYDVLDRNWRCRDGELDLVVIRRKGCGARETFTVRKVSFGVGVERTFPVHSPIIARIEVVSRGDVRRAKLYYLRDRVGKAAKIRERRA